MPDLEGFFSKLQARLAKLDRQEDQTEYLAAVRENAREIRDKVLKYLMVRRTRREIERHFPDDLGNQGLRFPEVADPEATYYELNPDEDRIFNETVQLIARDFKYSRYTPMLYYKAAVSQPEELGQKNMGRFMKILLVKRLESSFHAFRNTIDRFIHSYDMFLEQYGRGAVWVSKDYTSKIFELLEDDDEERVLKLVEEAKAHRYAASDFDPSFKADLEHDLAILRKIREIWGSVKRDPKLLKFVDLLSNRKVLRESKLVVFTESKETADYLHHALSQKFPGAVLAFTGSSSETVREKVIANFDARARHQRDDHRILVTTEVLAEGVNLHRSNVVVNYDIPWNPTRLMQRVGRINRIDTAFDKIYTFNFFPTRQSNDQIKLKEAAEAKIHAFITLLGADARLLTEGEPIEHHELFDRLISRKTITGEDEEEESGLKYLQVIREIRDKDPDLFASIKRLPKKARTARPHEDHTGALLTYFRKGRLQKFFLAKGDGSRELDFLSAAKLLETNESKRQKLGTDFYKLLDYSKEAFAAATLEDAPELRLKGGRDTNTQLLKVLRAVRDTRQLTEEQEQYLRRVTTQLEEGGIPKQTAKSALKGVEILLKDGLNPRKVVAALLTSIPEALLAEHFAGSAAQTTGPREVILSEYFVAG
jgi:superfamily II DNA/RNA helicase